MLAKLELPMKKPDALVKVKGFLKSLGNDIKVKEENITNKKLEAFNSVCGGIKLSAYIEPKELEEARAKNMSYNVNALIDILVDYETPTTYDKISKNLAAIQILNLHKQKEFFTIIF